MRPLSGCSNPASMRSTVVLPLPDGPNSARKCPYGTVNETSATARVVPKRLLRLETSTDTHRPSPRAQQGDGHATGEGRHGHDAHGHDGHGRAGTLLEIVVLVDDLHGQRCLARRLQQLRGR